MKYTDTVVDSNNLRDIQLLRYILMSINHQPGTTDD